MNLESFENIEWLVINSCYLLIGFFIAKAFFHKIREVFIIFNLMIILSFINEPDRATIYLIFYDKPTNSTRSIALRLQLLTATFNHNHKLNKYKQKFNKFHFHFLGQ